MTTRVATAALAGLLLAAGCTGSGKPLPTTYPVSGKVLYADGTPMTGGLVQFKPEGNPDVTTTGAIQQDGSFTLNSTVEKQQVEGAIEGPHTVTILPPLGEDQRAARGGAPLPVQLRETITVKADGPNNFTLTVPKGR
ncbi:MAG TPA: hypothetical protein VKA46_37250 [Gemmataceae bacterium]|nr:hypothetical protein [Gemmataceae bacterium]